MFATCNEMVASALAIFLTDTAPTEMAKLSERLAGTLLGKAG
jgi:hypothetical protein